MVIRPSPPRVGRRRAVAPPAGSGRPGGRCTALTSVASTSPSRPRPGSGRRGRRSGAGAAGWTAGRPPRSSGRARRAGRRCRQRPAWCSEAGSPRTRRSTVTPVERVSSKDATTPAWCRSNDGQGHRLGLGQLDERARAEPVQRGPSSARSPCTSSRCGSSSCRPRTSRSEVPAAPGSGSRSAAPSGLRTIRGVSSSCGAKHQRRRRRRRPRGWPAASSSAASTGTRLAIDRAGDRRRDRRAG